jgi:hypothetical protein
MANALSRFSQTAEILVARQWRPLPGYVDTKRPSIKGWSVYNSRQWERDELNAMISGRGNEQGEIVCLAIQREIVAIDLDITDPVQALFVETKAKEIFGETPLVRIGREPRRMLIYRNDGTIRSRKYHPIEVFSGSGEIVAFGYHTGAGRDYLWPDKSPLQLNADDVSIPLIGQRLLDAFLDECWTVIERKPSERESFVEPVFIGNDFENDQRIALEAVTAAANVLATADEGNRNNLLFHASYIAGQAIGAGLVQKDQVELIIGNAAMRCGLTADDGYRAVQATVASGFAQGNKNPFFVVGQWFEKLDGDWGEQGNEWGSERGEGKFQNDSDATFDDLVPFSLPPTLVKGLLPKSGIAFIGGQSGAGKTFIAIDLAVSLTTGIPFFGKRVKEKVGVLIIAGEGAATIQPRITVSRMAKNIEGKLPIAWLSGYPDFTKPEQVRSYFEKIKGVGRMMAENYGVRLGVIIIDTLAAVFDLEDENDNSEASKIIRAMNVMSEALGVVVVPVHHYGKGAETGLRGASAWRAGSDIVLSITADRNQLTGVVSDHRLWLAKSRVGEEGPIGGFDLKRLAITVDEDGDEVSSCYVAATVVPHMSAEVKKTNEGVALDLLASGEWRVDPRAEDWAGVAIAEAFGLDRGDKGQLVQIKNILRQLIAEGKLKEVTRNDENRRPRRFIIVENSDNLSAKMAAPVAPVDVTLEHELEQVNLFD